MSSAEWQLTGSEPGPELTIFRARYDTFLHPVTQQPKRATVLEGQPWCNAVAVTPEGDLVMIRQFRFGVAEVGLEIAGGLVDPGEEHGAAAKRELREETGYTAPDWVYLGNGYQNPAFLDNLCHLWYARGATHTHDTAQEGGEHIAVEVMSQEQVRAAVRDGTLRHAHAIVALSRVLDLRVV